MNNQPTNNMTNENETQYKPQVEAPEEAMAFGPIIGILIIVAILVFGGLYFWGASLQQDQDAALLPVNTDNTGFETTEPAIEEYTMTDDEFEALFNEEGDTANTVLEATLDDLSDLDSLDAELDALELEL